MKKYTPHLLVGIFCIITFAWITYLKYDLHLVDYLRYSMPLTSGERQYLAGKGTLLCGSDKNAPPISFINPESGQYEGLIIDYIAFLSVDLGAAMVCKPLVWGEVTEQLQGQRVDMVDLTPSVRRRQQFLFSQPIYLLRGSMAVSKQEKSIHALRDLGGKLVAVPRGDYAMEYLSVHPDLQKAPPFLLEVPDIAKGMEILEKNEVDALVGDEVVLDHYRKLSPKSGICILPQSLYQQQVTLAVRKEEKLLLSILNKGILALKKKDLLFKIQEKWFGVSAPIIKGGFSYKWVSTVVLLVEALFVGMYVWTFMLQKKVEEKTGQLESSKADLQTIINTLQVYLFVVDEEGRIVDCNLAAEKFMKQEKSRLLGVSLFQQEPLKEIYRWKDVEGQIIRGHYYVVTEQPLKSPAGSRLITVEDVTEKRVNEQKLRQESKMAAIGQLSAGLAHEIRNPLGLIKSYLYVMKKYVMDETGSHAVWVIRNSADRINQLIENLLNFSRFSKDKVSTVNLKQFIENIAQLERKKLEKLGIRLEMDCDAQRVILNEESFKIILFNLLDNAADALAKTERECKQIDVRAKKAGFHLLIQVEDNGCGIKEEDLENLFNPFFTTKDTGTGLGLYVVSREVEHNNGTIQVISGKGQGACFTIQIPMTDPQGEQ